jgi:hypothetical protein
MTAPRTTIAGIAISDSALAREATEFVRDASTQLLLRSVTGPCSPLSRAAVALDNLVSLSFV